jgi:MYXO-CTERM domain-containing protein
VSQYTSLVAVDETPAAPGATGEPMQIAQPAEAPEGVDLRTAGGAALGVVQGNVAPATTTGSTAIDESPSPMAPGSREVYATETVSRRGGCAGCTVPRGASRAPYAAVAALALAMFARRRRR